MNRYLVRIHDVAVAGSSEDPLSLGRRIGAELARTLARHGAARPPRRAGGADGGGLARSIALAIHERIAGGRRHE